MATKTKKQRKVLPLTEVELDPEQTPFLSPRRLAQANLGDHDTLLKGVKSGAIPAIQFQRTWRIPTRWVRRALGLDVDSAA
jgi:hypothetical protein